jgi:CRP/FNR family transcriptional regulator
MPGDLSLFSTLEPALRAEIEAKSTLVKVNPGDVMLVAGQPVWGIPLVVEGTFKVSRVTDDGQEVLLYYVYSGETCAMSFTSWMTTQISSITSTAEEESRVYVVPGTIADDWMSRFPSWKKFVMATVLDGFSQIVKSIDDVAFKKTDERLVNYLKEKSRISGSSLVNQTHQEIANDLGTNRVVVSRLLKKLEIGGRLLLYRNQIKIMRDL